MGLGYVNSTYLPAYCSCLGIARVIIKEGW